jgi:hypothetical protein
VDLPATDAHGAPKERRPIHRHRRDHRGPVGDSQLPNKFPNISGPPMTGGPYFVIAAGATPRPCRECQEPIYMVPLKTGNWMPVSVESDDPQVHAPQGVEDGLGVSHFSNCPKAAQFRRAR